MHLLHSATKPVALTKLCHISACIVQFVVFTPLFATLPPPLYIVYCDTMNFTLSIVHTFAIIQSPLRGWGFAFGEWRADIQNRDCLYKNPDSSKSMVNLIYKFKPFQIPCYLYKNPYKHIGRRAPNDEQYTSP
nr:MAG TPA: hypothetical protein [Caudoviricetes sp.]